MIKMKTSHAASFLMLACELIVLICFSDASTIETINPATRERMAVFVERTDKVADLKDKLSVLVGSPARLLHLMDESDQYLYSDDRTVLEENLLNSHRLVNILQDYKFHEDLEIRIQAEDPKMSLTVMVEKGSTIEALKYRLESKFGMSSKDFVLELNGSIVGWNTDLRNVKANDTFVLVNLKTKSNLICDFVTIKPSFMSGIKRSAMIKNDARTSLANFDGYLQFKQSGDTNSIKFKYIPLRLTSMKSSKQTMSYASVLTLGATCATLELTLKETNDVIRADQIKINIQAEPSLSDLPEACYIKKDAGRVAFKRGSHYRCYSRLEFDCFKTPDDESNDAYVATLVIESMAFELDGNADLIDQNKYSSSPTFCGSA